MPRIIFAASIVCLWASIAAGQPAPLKPALAGLDFLIGRWTGVDGRVADTGGTSKGSSVITAQAGGAVLLRQDHTDLFDAGGKPLGGFDQIMTVYVEAGSLRADYLDGDHVIHYTSATVDPGKSVVFISAASPGVPVFRLRYELQTPDTLGVSFAMAAPGQSEFHDIATGALRKSG
jgi:hypothetical protein